MNKNKPKHITINRRFYDSIERERKKFMKKEGLTRLSTTAFTGILEAKIIRRKRK